MPQYLKVQKTRVLKENKPVILKGVNLGGWLMMEGYILGSPNFAKSKFKENFRKILGDKELNNFEQDFRSNFIQEEDFKIIKELGFNCIRLPFTYRLVENNKTGLKVLDEAIRWARKYKIYIILDLHAAPGAQNHDWHSDSSGKAQLWLSKANQKRTFKIWELLADRYKSEEGIAGYDLLNESVVDDAKVLNQFYKELIHSVRHVDKNHILFIEGNKWATDINCLDRFEDNNYALSIHSYEPLNFTFNFVPHQRYPSENANKDSIRRHLEKYKKVSEDRKLPVLVGEFGVNGREGLFGEDKWLRDNLQLFKEFGFSWTYWTYKAIKGFMFPDGIYSYYDNPAWVNRHGPLTGWDTYHLHWKERRSEIVDSWATKHFTKNTALAETLRKYAR